jgi:hypothetical protein
MWYPHYHMSHVLGIVDLRWVHCWANNTSSRLFALVRKYAKCYYSNVIVLHVFVKIHRKEQLLILIWKIQEKKTVR